MTSQQGPIESRFPDKNSRLILEPYRATLQADDQAIQALIVRGNVFSQQERAIHTLREIREHIQEIFELLENSSRLPMAIVPVRFELLTKVRNAYEQIQKLIILMNELYYKIDRLNPTSVDELQSKIFEALRLLRSNQKEILRLLSP